MICTTLQLEKFLDMQRNLDGLLLSLELERAHTKEAKAKRKKIDNLNKQMAYLEQAIKGA
jgi:hypothetical protein